MNKLPLLILYLINFISTAQTPLTKKETDEIRYNARRKVEKDLPELLNTLNLSDIGDFERKTLILNSYLPSQTQVFYSDGVVIEDDLRPNNSLKDPPIDVSVDKYLNNIDLFYVKSDVATIKVENVVVSPVKQSKNQVTIQVYFTSIFNGTHKTIKQPYVPQLRIAELKGEKNDSQWSILISSIRFNRGESLPNINKIEDDKYKKEQLIKEMKQKRNQEIVDKLPSTKKIEDPIVSDQYVCQLPSTISIIRDPVISKTLSFAMNQSTTDIATMKWTIKSVDGTIINTSNFNAYSLTLANEGSYTIQADLVSKCGESKTLNADFDVYSICNVVKYDTYFKSKGYESLVNISFSYNAINEIVKEETYDNSSFQRRVYNYEKSEANLGSLTQPYIKNGSIKIFCDLQKRVIKEVSDHDIVTYYYGKDGFLEQKVQINDSTDLDIEKITKYQYSSTGLTQTYFEFSKKTKLSQLKSEYMFTYSDQIKSPKYIRNYGYNYGKQPPFYYKNEIYSSYDYSTSITPTITIISQDSFVNILDKNNQPISEKRVSVNYSLESRKFIFDCK